MAYWTIPFKSVNGTDYVVRILGADEDTELIGSAEPITTQEDDNDDLFTPVRTQSGYVRFVDETGDTWRKILPSSSLARYVELIRGGTIVWQGYIKPESYGCEYGVAPQVHEFPIHCALSVLASFDYEPNGDIITFGTLLYQLLSKAGIRFTNVYLPNDMAHTWLTKKVNCFNFLDYDEDEDRYAGKYNCLEVLEQICSFWGVTCRTYRDNIYFVAPEDPDGAGGYIGISWRTIEDGETLTPDTHPWDKVAMPESFLKGSAETILQGYRWAKVTADINKIDDVFETPDSEIEEEYRAAAVTKTVVKENEVYWFEKNIPAKEQYNLSNCTISICPMNKDYGAAVVIYDSHTGVLNNKHNYSWKFAYKVKGEYPQDQQLIKIKSKGTYGLYDGIMVINFNTCYPRIEGDKIEQYSGIGSLLARLKVGNKYWNGSAWVESATTDITFYIPIDGERLGTGKAQTNRELDSPYPSFEGWGIAVNEPIGGILEFDIIGYELNPLYILDNTVFITDISLSFFRQLDNADPKQREKNEYKSESNADFAETKEISTIFATDNNNAFGNGIVMEEDGSYCQGLNYSGFIRRPEQRLADRIAAYGARTHRMLELEVDSNDITPATLMLEGTSVFYPVAVSWEWRHDNQKIKLVNL